MTTEFHEIAGIFPLMSDAKLAELVDNIKTWGMRHPITLFEGKILDGRSRYRACALAGMRPAYHVFKGSWDAAAHFVLAENLECRRLNMSQRAIALVKYESLLEAHHRTTDPLDSWLRANGLRK